MVIYVCKTQNGIWTKADPNDQASITALKIWWTTEGNSVLDYLDRAFTADRRKPVYAILSLGKPDKAVSAFRVKMAEMAVKIKMLNPQQFHAMIVNDFEA